MDKKLCLTFEGICLRPAAATDCRQLADWWNDGEVVAHAGFPNGLGITAQQIHQQLAA